MLRRIGKRGMDVDKVPAQIDLLRGRFQRITASFIWGFPFESLQDLADTLALKASIHGGNTVTALHLLAALPSVPITREYGSCRKFDPHLLPDMSSVRLSKEAERLVEEHVEVFSSFYYFDHDSFSLKLKTVRRVSGSGGQRKAVGK